MRRRACQWIANVFFGLAGASSMFGQGYSPEQAVGKMTLAPGFEASLVAAEPMVRQPVAIEFDDRGRLWVVQYLQYPNPEGLQRVQVDRYSRTKYDKVPPPPPKGPKGADRITILEDSDGDGRADKAKDFVSGLNLASGIAFAHGGVFVLQVPYLLFYPDRNRDDVPDSDPEVLLEGFGMEDAHSVANSLTIGPDGWLYGCQGSTVTANIRGIEFQQGVWRYHYPTKQFELFCEGGGNSWGLDFDAEGRLFYSTNVGGHVLLHAEQGAYYWKSFGKHGALHNPYAFGYFEHAKHKNFKGGHVTVGGVVYQSDLFPPEFRGCLIAGDLLGHGVYWHRIIPIESTFRTEHGGELLVANDTWFAPSDVTIGPDGAVYVCDWHDQRTAHPDPDAEWDRRNGRIYRIAPKEKPRPKLQDLTTMTAEQQIQQLYSPNDWYVRRARKLLSERKDPNTFDALKSRLRSRDDSMTLQYFWTLTAAGAVDEPLARMLLDHRSPAVRRWAIRWIGDQKKSLSSETRNRLVQLAERDSGLNPADADERRRGVGPTTNEILAELTNSCRRLPSADALPILFAVENRAVDLFDARARHRLWWAFGDRAISDRDEILKRFCDPKVSSSSFLRYTLFPNLTARYASENTAAGDASCMRIWRTYRKAEDRRFAEIALFNVLDTKRFQSPPEMFRSMLSPPWGAFEEARLCIGVLFHDEQSLEEAKRRAADKSQPSRWLFIDSLGRAADPGTIDTLVALLSPSEPGEVRSAALNALRSFKEERVAKALVELYASSTPTFRAKIRSVLFQRAAWAKPFLEQIIADKLPADGVEISELTALAPFKDKQIDELVRKKWGSVQQSTPEEKLAIVRRLNNDLRAGAGDPAAGKELFKKHCASCHRLFDVGNAVGPELTTANRADRDFLLTSAVDPSGAIRKEYLAYVVQCKDGRVLTGMIAQQTPTELTILTAKNERVVVRHDDVESTTESAVSLMPEKLLEALKPQELRDLFSFLQSTSPQPTARADAK